MLLVGECTGIEIMPNENIHRIITCGDCAHKLSKLVYGDWAQYYDVIFIEIEMEIQMWIEQIAIELESDSTPDFNISYGWHLWTYL